MSTDGTGIQDDEELQKEIHRVLKWLVIIFIVFILYGLLIYG